MVGLRKAERNGIEVTVLVTTRGVFAREGGKWFQQINDGWALYTDGRFVRACAKYSGVLREYNTLMGR